MDYQIIKSKRKTVGIQVKMGRVIVRAPMRAGRAEIESYVQRLRPWIEKQLETQRRREAEAEKLPPLYDEDIRALAEKAKARIPERVAYYAPIIGVSYGRITIRNQRSRWGSCSSKGNLNFNCLLMLTPPEVLDCVVVHELCHIRHMNHSKEFYADVLRVCPDYRESEKWLKEKGSALMQSVVREQT
ncbi:MAG: M48 family metallopeptidase [Oscillospiraceae bacterium]|nr:M48 family metallopeptidase [Oscillospiraceae bacterium]